MEKLVLEAQVRTERGKEVSGRSRRIGIIPAVVYGDGKETVALAISPKQLSDLLRAGGANAILQLQIGDGATTPVMVVDHQREPLRGNLLHVDLKRIALDKKVHVKVRVILTGEPRGVKTENGVLEFVSRELDVECLPLDIPAMLTIAVDDLGLGDLVRVADLQERLEKGIRILGDPHTVICHVVTVKEVEEKPAEEAVVAATPAEPEVIKKGKVVEEEEKKEKK